LAVLSITTSAAAVWLHLANESHAGVVSVLLVSDVAVAVAYPLVGAFLLRRRPGNRLGWVLMTTSLLGPYALASQYAVHAIVVGGERSPVANAAAFLSVWGWAPNLLLPPLLPLLFPDGLHPDRRSRRLAQAVWLLAGVAVAFRMVAVIPSDVSPEITNPLGLAFAFNFPVALCAYGLFLIVAPLSVASVVRRHRMASGRERAQLQWLMVGGLACVAGAIAQIPVPDPWGDALFAVGLIAVPVAIALAVSRHRLLDIEVVLNRTLVYGALTIVVLLAYGAAVVLVGRLAFGRGLALAVVALGSLIAASARDRVQLLVDQLLYGQRRDPYGVVARLGGRLDQATGPSEALGVLGDELRSALKLPFVAILPHDARLTPVTSGVPVATVERLPIAVQGIDVGDLEVGHRHPGERFRAEETSLLGDVARRAGALLQAAGLVSDLRRSRERLVIAREEERRRLRHDLHDGLGPELAGIALQLDSLSDRVAHDDHLAVPVERLRARVRQTVAEVRRIVEDLRPPALDELGLLGSLREQLAVFEGSGVTVEVIAPYPLLDLPAAVEVAAYRIATEAVTNAVRHGSCASCTVELAVDSGWLTISVVDDGRGMSPAARPGVGLQSMRERSAELRGTFEVTVPGGGSGTLIRARLPLEQR